MKKYLSGHRQKASQNDSQRCQLSLVRIVQVTIYSIGLRLRIAMLAEADATSVAVFVLFAVLPT